MNIWHDIDEERIFPTDFMSVIEISKGSNQKWLLFFVCSVLPFVH